MPESLREAIEASYDELVEEAGGEDSAGEGAGEQISEFQDAEGAQPTPQEVEPLEPPSDWKASAKDKWGTLPRDVQEYLLERSKELTGDYTRKTQEAAELKRQYEEQYGDVHKVLQPHMSELQRRGISPGQLVSQFMAWQQTFDENPVNGLLKLAASYGLTADHFAQVLQQSPASKADPALTQLQQELEELRAWKEEQETQRQQAVQHSSQKQLEARIDAFRTQKNEKGEPLRPHFERIAPSILGLMPQLLQSPELQGREIEDVLQIAYDRALAPFKEMLDEQAKQQAQKAQAAKRASSSVSGTSGGSRPPQKARSIREAIEQAYEELSS